MRQSARRPTGSTNRRSAAAPVAPTLPGQWPEPQALSTIQQMEQQAKVRAFVIWLPESMPVSFSRPQAPPPSEVAIPPSPVSKLLVGRKLHPQVNLLIFFLRRFPFLEIAHLHRLFFSPDAAV